MPHVQIEYELGSPAYLEEVMGTVSRVEDYGVFLDFSWNGKTLTGLLGRDEMKVPLAKLSAAEQEAAREEWADTDFEAPEFVEIGDDQLDVKKFYQPGDQVPAFVLETPLIGNIVSAGCRPTPAREPVPACGAATQQ